MSSYTFCNSVRLFRFKLFCIENVSSILYLPTSKMIHRVGSCIQISAEVFYIPVFA